MERLVNRRCHLPRLLIFLPILLGSLGASACSRERGKQPGLEALEANPLMAEVIADQMIDFVTSMRIRADERGQPITDGAVLRAMDETLIIARRMQKHAHERQDMGKSGWFYGVNDGYIVGEVLLFEDSLYFGPDFQTEAVPGLMVLLAQHPAPSTLEELRSEPTLDLGPLQNVLGPQMYVVGALTEEERNRYRTVVLLSEPFQRILGLSQIRQRPSLPP
jgi:hypothetical protein